jgi:hypothetical protein
MDGIGALRPDVGIVPREEKICPFRPTLLLPQKEKQKEKESFDSVGSGLSPSEWFVRSNRSNIATNIYYYTSLSNTQRLRGPGIITSGVICLGPSLPIKGECLTGFTSGVHMGLVTNHPRYFSRSICSMSHIAWMYSVDYARRSFWSGIILKDLGQEVDPNIPTLEGNESLGDVKTFFKKEKQIKPKTP